MTRAHRRAHAALAALVFPAVLVGLALAAASLRPTDHVGAEHLEPEPPAQPDHAQPDHTQPPPPGAPSP